MNGHNQMVAKELLKKAGAKGIKYLRKKHNYTRKEFANEVLVDKSTIGKWERKTQKPNDLSLERMVYIFGEKIVQDDFFREYLGEDKWHGRRVKLYPAL